MLWRSTQAGWYSLLAIVAALGIVIAIGAIRAAVGAEHEHLSAAGRFYATWMMPDKRTVSCCDQKDCYATAARYVDGAWFARVRETGEWVRIPPEKIETERDNPDGQNHLCASPAGHVYCFITGGGT